jgi:hypothetical protein
MFLATYLVLFAIAAQAQTGMSRLMLANVTDARGRAIVDLGPDDFVVQEAAATREILSVRVTDYPIIVVLETGSASEEEFALAQKAAARFIERLGNERPVIVATGGTPPRLLATFDDARKTVLDRLNALEPGRSAEASRANGTRRLGAAALAAQALHGTGTLFSSIVLLSTVARDEDTEPGADVLAPIVESGAIVHAIVQTPSRPEPGTRNPLLTGLRALVNQTRGEFTPIYSAASFQAALDRLVDRLGNEMLIEYLVPPGSKPIDPKIGIRVPGARVRGLGVAPR